MSNLQNNIASLEALITKANALPEEKTIQSSKTVTPTTSSQTIKPDGGYDGLAQVLVNGDDNLIAGNIASGVSIFGIIGTHSGGTDTSDATATADDIVVGETAYVNSVKLIGINPYAKVATDAAVNNQTNLLSQIVAAIAAKATPTATYTIHIGTIAPTSDIGNDGDIYIMREASE